MARVHGNQAGLLMLVLHKHFLGTGVLASAVESRFLLRPSVSLCVLQGAGYPPQSSQTGYPKYPQQSYGQQGYGLSGYDESASGTTGMDVKYFDMYVDMAEHMWRSVHTTQHAFA